MLQMDPARSTAHAEEEGREARISRWLLALTVLASGLLAWDLLAVLLDFLRTGSHARVAEQVVFIGIAATVIYGSLVHQVTRLGYARRRETFRPAPRERLDRIHDEDAPPLLTVLVPSYKEEPDVVRRTLLSAALQSYPRRRVVLLIDDPPRPDNRSEAAALRTARSLPAEVAALFEKPALRFSAALREFTGRHDARALDLFAETASIAELHAEAATWFESQASNLAETDSADRLLTERIRRGPVRRHRTLAERFERDLSTGALPDAARLLREHRRLAALFTVEITCFERKRYVNLSHEPNKAMNLNSYIGLIGRRLREVERDDGSHLADAEGAADLVVPESEFLITLDADSVLDPDYALLLMESMRAAGNEQIAVAQTPYSAFPNAPGVLERVAGATTDVQYIVHQGFTRHGATYWVGANALLRTAALREIATSRRERGHRVPVFVQDRTVIEDTESSVDLIARGYRLFNHPERLAWSATPPDFGSLLIQRSRWANGGLLILPKLLRYLARGRLGAAGLLEGWLRVHYLVSITAMNLSLLALLVWPFEHALRTLWFPLAAAPYFYLYGRDLVRMGYPAGDLLRAYALNLLLLPVNLAGVWKSLRQLATGRKSPFGRTPKVPGRTAAPAAYHVAEYALALAIAVGFVADLATGRWLHAFFLLANGAALGYALVSLVGPRQTWEDLRASSSRTISPSRPPTPGDRDLQTRVLVAPSRPRPRAAPARRVGTAP